MGTSAAHIRRAAVRGIGTFTWGFLRHSPASVLARGKNRRESRVMTVVEAVGTFPHCHPYPTFLMRAFEAASDSALVLAELPADTSAIPG